MRGPIRKTLLVIGLSLIGLMVLWQLPGGPIHPLQLDYVRAFDDPATRSIIVNAAFDAGSLAVIDSCEHDWRGNDLTIRMRSKMFLSRDGRTWRIGAFRIPYTDIAPSSLTLSGGAETATISISPTPAGFTPLVPVIDSKPR